MSVPTPFMQRLSPCDCHLLPAYLNTPLPPSPPVSLSGSPSVPIPSTIAALLHFPRSVYPFQSHPTPPLFSSSSAPPPLSRVYCSRKASTDTSMCVFVHVCAATVDLRVSFTRSWAEKEVKKRSPACVLNALIKTLIADALHHRHANKKQTKSLEQCLSSCLPVFPLVSRFLPLSFSLSSVSLYFHNSLSFFSLS